MNYPITIDLLKNHPQYISELPILWYELFGKKWEPATTLQEITSWCHSWLNNDILPLAYIALANKRPVGMCSLEINDGVKPNLTPWLCDLCVATTYQGKGIGKSLIAAVQQKAKSLGFDKLYLFILDVAMLAFYSPLGWKKIGVDSYKGYPAIVMEKVLYSI